MWVVLSGSSQDRDSSSDCRREDSPGSRLPHFVLQGKTHFPEMFQTGHLLFYERFRAYQDYILGEPRSLPLRVPGAVCVGPSHSQWPNGPLTPLRAWPCPPPAGLSLSARCVFSLQPTARPPR